MTKIYRTRKTIYSYLAVLLPYFLYFTKRNQSKGKNLLNFVGQELVRWSERPEESASGHKTQTSSRSQCHSCNPGTQLIQRVRTNPVNTKSADELSC